MTTQRPPNQTMRLVLPLGKPPFLVLLVVLAVVVYLLREALVPFVAAGAIAYVATPVVDWLAARLPLGRRVIASFVFVVIVGALGGLALLVVTAAIHDLGALSQRLSENLAFLSSRLTGVGLTLFGHHVPFDRIVTGLGEDLRRWIDDPTRATQAMKWGAGLLFGGVLTLVLLFYFLLSGKRLARGALWLVPPHHRPFVETFAQRFDPVLRRYVVGMVAIALYTGVVAWIFIGPVLGLPDPLLLAAISGLLEPIVFFGPLLAPIIVGSVALDYGNAATIVGFLVYAVTLRLSIDQIVGPLVLGTAVRLPASVIILAFIAGWVLFGFIGLLLAVPVAAAIKTALAIAYEDGEDHQAG